jgi:hypothetical protein
MKDKQVVFYAVILSGAIHLAVIGALGGSFNFSASPVMPKTQVVNMDKKKISPIA